MQGREQLHCWMDKLRDGLKAGVSKMKKTAMAILALTVCALCAITPLLTHSEFFSGGWDLSIHLYHTFQVSTGIKEGLLYPRWLPLSNGGLWKSYHYFLFTSFLYPHRDHKPCCSLSDRLFESHNLFGIPSIRHMYVFISAKFLRSYGKFGRGDSLSAVAISPL